MPRGGAERDHMVRFAEVAPGIKVPVEFILHATERDEDGIVESVKSAVKGAAKQFGVELTELNVGAAKPFGIQPLSPDIFDVGQRWVFTPTTAGTFNDIISAVRTPRDSRVVIWGIADRAPSQQFVALQFTIDGDTQPLLNIERMKNWGLNSQWGREAYFPRDLILEIGGARAVTVTVYSTGIDQEEFQLLGIQIVTRAAAVSKDIGALVS